MLDDIVNKYNNTVHRTIKIKPIEVTDNYYAEYDENPNKKDPKFKVGDHVRTSKYKNWSEEVFFVSKIENTVPWTSVVSDLDGGEITGSFSEN